MQPKPIAKPCGPTPQTSDVRIKSLIALIDELIALVAEENAELAKGLPASRLKQVDEKNRLAELFERSRRRMRGRARPP